MKDRQLIADIFDRDIVSDDVALEAGFGRFLLFGLGGGQKRNGRNEKEKHARSFSLSDPGYTPPSRSRWSLCERRRSLGRSESEADHFPRHAALRVRKNRKQRLARSIIAPTKQSTQQPSALRLFLFHGV